MLRISLFWKILWANIALVALGACAAVALTVDVGRLDPGTVTAMGILAAVLVVLASVAVNAALVQLALKPISDLEETATRISRGDLAARAPTSAVADEALNHLVRVFNEMLDTLSANRTRQQELARRVLQSEERERQRIAHELYSGTAQTLAGVLVRLRVAERHLAGGYGGSMEEIRKEVVSALEEIRGVARRLRPPELDELGVQAALEAHARSMTEGRRIEVVFEGYLDEERLSRESSLALFRIIQEAISNAVIHGDPDTVTVRFMSENGRLRAEVQDDGVGFDPGRTLSHTDESLGIYGMHERAGYVEGELAVESGPGRGTVVRVAIPWEGVRTDLGIGGIDEGAVDRLVEGVLSQESKLAEVGQPRRTEATAHPV